jgi:hypothetical protein
VRTRLILILLVEVAVLAFLVVQLASAGAPQPATSDAAESRAPAADAAAPTPSAEVAANARADTARATPAPEAPRTELATHFDPDDPVGVLLTGTVRWRDGGAAVAHVSASAGQVRRGNDTASDGTFAIAGLRPGEWSFRIQGEGAADATFTHTLTRDPVQVHDFVLDRSFAVRVRIVTPDGKDATRALRMSRGGLADFHVVGQRNRLPESLALTGYLTPTLGDARWQGERNPIDGHAGTLHLREAPPGHVGLLVGSKLVEQQVVQLGQDSVTFTVDVDALVQGTPTVSVRVLDADTGEPVTQARVAIENFSSGTAGLLVDADGRSRQPANAGLHRLSIMAPDHERYAAIVRVFDAPVDLGDVRLGALQPLRGHVVDSDDKPVPATVTWTELKWRNAPTTFHQNRIARADAEGAFTLYGTGSGRIAVQARTNDQRIAVGVFDNPPTTPVELRVDHGAVLEISRPVDPTRAFTVTVFDTRRDPISAQRMEPGLNQVKLLLPAGAYTFEVHDDHDRLVQSGAVELGAQPAKLVIR